MYPLRYPPHHSKEFPSCNRDPYSWTSLCHFLGWLQHSHSLSSGYLWDTPSIKGRKQKSDKGRKLFLLKSYMERWCSGGRATQRKWWLLVVCRTDWDPGDSSQKVSPISFNQLLPTSTWCYLSHFQWQCFLRWGWYTSWHSCGRAGMFWWRWQCWGSRPSPAEKGAQRGKPIFLKVWKIAPESILVGLWRASLPLLTSSSALPFYLLPSYLILLTPSLPSQLIVSIPFSLAPGNLSPHSP